MCVCVCVSTFQAHMCIYVLTNMCISTFMLYSIYCHTVCLDIKLHHHYYLYERNSLCVLAFSISSDHRWTVTVQHSLCSCTSAVSLLQHLFFKCVCCSICFLNVFVAVSIFQVCVCVCVCRLSFWLTC